MIITAPRLIQTRPQVHSQKLHHTYNACKVLPVAACVRTARRCEPTAAYLSTLDRGEQQRRDDSDVEAFFFGVEDADESYEIVLYYDHNRACTIYRSWEDFLLLYRNLRPWRGAPKLEEAGPNDVLAIHLFLKDAIVRRAGAVALEFFLRRRMGDCAR